MENEIVNIVSYNRSMSCSLIDKIFFMDKIDSDIEAVVDYGCADGALLKFLAGMFPDISFCGYDSNSKMIDEAAKNCNDYKNINLTSSISNLMSHLEYDNKRLLRKSVILLSSVIHEVYSYVNKEEIDNFWNFVTNSGFTYIVIRDMCLDESAHRPSLKEDVFRIKSKYDKVMLDQFERIHGTITDNYNLVHFLLKYRYTENWQREVVENYLPLSIEQISRNINGYNLVYYDHYILPYLENVVHRDFGITLKDYTHVKMIFKKG